MSEARNKIGYRDVFRQKEYLKIIIAALINRFGDSVDAIASTWITYELTSNATWSAIIFGMNRLPSVFITPFAGAWVETRNKKKIMLVTDIIRALCIAFLATSYLLDFLQAWMLIITSLIISTAEAFRGPANTALTPKILEKEYYEYAMSLMSTLSTVTELIGTALAAGIIALIGTAGAIYVDMITFILSAIIILFVNSKETSLVKSDFNTTKYKEMLIEGVEYVRRKEIVFGLLIVCAFLNGMLVPFNSLQAPLSSEILLGGAEMLSVMGVALMAGMILGSITYPVVSVRMKGKWMVFCGGECIAIYYLILVLGQPLYHNRIILYIFVTVSSLLFGYFISLLMSYLNVQIVRKVEEHYLARVSAIVSSVGSATMPIVSFIIGLVTVFISTESIFLITGVIGIAICCFVLFTKIFD